MPAGATQSTVFLVWKDSYAVGHAVIDDQHRRLVGLINDLYVALQQNQGSALLGTVFDELENYSRTHFATEEEILRQCRFPKLPSHKVLHDYMIARTHRLRVELQGGEAAAKTVLVLLKEWWLNHICGCDRTYIPYIYEHICERADGQ